MNVDPQPGAEPQDSPASASPAPLSACLDKYERRQQELWRLTFFLLFLVTCVFAWFSWDTLRTTRFRLEALPFGLVALVALLGVYVWKKTQEIAELKGMVRGLDQKDSAPPSDRALEHLFQMISKSQQGFRDLIDSFDDILLALSLDGEIRAANRSFVDFVGQSFQEVIGVPLSRLISDENAISE
jgi:PAS domain-containing protein